MSARSPSPAALSADAERFLACIGRPGLCIPPDRLAGVLAVHAELRRMAALLRQARPVESEPAPIFSLAALLGDSST